MENTDENIPNRFGEKLKTINLTRVYQKIFQQVGKGEMNVKLEKQTFIKRLFIYLLNHT